MGARNMPPLRWADTGPVAWRPPRCRGVVVWRCTPPGGRAVLSEVCGCCFKSAFARFRHAAPRNQHPRSRVSSRRLREIDPRLGDSSAAAPGEYGCLALPVVLCRLLAHWQLFSCHRFLSFDYCSSQRRGSRTEQLRVTRTSAPFLSCRTAHRLLRSLENGSCFCG